MKSNWIKLSFFTLLITATLFSFWGNVLAANFNINKDEVAIHGYDPVAYLTQSAAIEGNIAHEYEWKWVKWRFVNAENMALFMADPEKYAPQYGGFCAYAASIGKRADVNPRIFTIHEGKTYLNFSEEIQSIWKEDQAKYIQQADEAWPKMA